MEFLVVLLLTMIPTGSFSVLTVVELPKSGESTFCGIARVGLWRAQNDESCVGVF